MATNGKHPFYCTKKKCRKTAWDTPEYLTNEDWEVSKRVLTAKTGLDLAMILLEAFMNHTAEGFFNRVLGWPEGYHYCRSASFIERSMWPGFVQLERPKLQAAVEAHFGLFA